jgi:hypothetical protein
MAEAKGKNRVGKAEFEYRRDRTGRTRYEVRRAEQDADELASEKSEALTGAVEAVGMKEPKATATAARGNVKPPAKKSNGNEIADGKTAKARTKAYRSNP